MRCGSLPALLGCLGTMLVVLSPALAETGEDRAERALRARAEAVAEGASRRFAELLKADLAGFSGKRLLAMSDDPLQLVLRWLERSDREYRSIVRQLSRGAPHDGSARTPIAGSLASAALIAVRWLRGSRARFEAMMQRLAEGSATAKSEFAEGKPAPEASGSTSPAKGVGTTREPAAKDRGEPAEKAQAAEHEAQGHGKARDEPPEEPPEEPTKEPPKEPTKEQPMEPRREEQSAAATGPAAGAQRAPPEEKRPADAGATEGGKLAEVAPAPQKAGAAASAPEEGRSSPRPVREKAAAEGAPATEAGKDARAGLKASPEAPPKPAPSGGGQQGPLPEPAEEPPSSQGRHEPSLPRSAEARPGKVKAQAPHRRSAKAATRAKAMNGERRRRSRLRRDCVAALAAPEWNARGDKLIGIGPRRYEGRRNGRVATNPLPALARGAAWCERLHLPRLSGCGE